MFLGIGKASMTAIANLSAATAKTHAPAVVVESGRLHLDQNTVKSVPEFGTLQFLHDLKKNFVTVFVPEDLHNLTVGEPSQSVVDLLIGPVTRNTLQDHVAAKLANCIEGELGENSFCDSCALIKVEQLVTELDNIVSVAIHDESVHAEGYMGDQLPTDELHCRFIGLVLACQFPEPTHHMLYHTHGVFVKGKGQQVLNCVIEIWKSILERKGLDYFLNEVSGIVICAQFIEVESDFH